MTTEKRREIVADLKLDHSNYFEKNDIENPIFIAKLAYRPKGKDELHIQLYPSELNRKAEQYIEFVNGECEPIDLKRTLYKYIYNPYFTEEYEMITDRYGDIKYLVPVSDLIPVSDITNDREISNKSDNFGEESVVDLLRQIHTLISKYLNQK